MADEKMKPMTLDEYRTLWATLGPIEIKMIEKNERCPHEVGDTFCWQHPYAPPKDLKCHSLMHVLDFYIWRVAMDFPSWEDDDTSVYRIHCPGKKGTVWEMRKIKKETSDQ